MYFIKILFYLFLLSLTTEVFSADCGFSGMRKVDCDNCIAPYLIQCSPGGQRSMGFISGKVMITAKSSSKIRSEPYTEYLPLEEVYEIIEDDECLGANPFSCGPPLMSFRIKNNLPLYKTPLGQQVISYTGRDLSGELGQDCHYTPVDNPMIISFVSPKKVMHQVGGLQQTVCYGNISCPITYRLNPPEKVHPPEYQVHRVACTALPTGECPTPQECMQDPFVTFEQVAQIEETINEEIYDKLKDQMRLELAAEQIRRDVEWERLEQRINQLIAEKMKELDQKGDEIQERADTAVSDFPEARLRNMEEWVNMRRTLLEEMDRVRGTGRTGRSGVR